MLTYENVPGLTIYLKKTMFLRVNNIYRRKAPKIRKNQLVRKKIVGLEREMNVQRCITNKT